MDDTSRLSRNIGDADRVFEQLNFAGIRNAAVSQGIDTLNEQADVLITAHGRVDSLYIEELVKKTRRGLEGRAIQGPHTGGRCFGYDNVSDNGQVKLRINAVEVAIVQKIFGISADGCSLRTIAKRVNSEKVPARRPRAKTVRDMVSYRPDTRCFAVSSTSAELFGIGPNS